MKIFYIIITFIVFFGNAFSADTIINFEKEQLIFGNSRQFLINDNWFYLEDPIDNIYDLAKSQVPWIEVTLPHTWNAFDAVDAVPGYRRSASWYKKEIHFPASISDSRVILHFEGINTQAQVYVNQQLAGGHIGGYLGFEIDITHFIKQESKNIIDVRADNSIDQNIIPSQTSDFFIYGGICRNVWMKIVSPQYVKSVKIRTPQVSKDIAKTVLNIDIVNTTTLKFAATIETAIKVKGGDVVVQKNIEKVVSSGLNVVSIEMPGIGNPLLWSPSNPNLYTVIVTIKEGSKIIDTVSEQFGYRWFEFKDNGPFFINGERLLLRGTQRHEEYAGLGNALPDSLHWKDMRLAKEMGVNFVRLAHYPQSPEVYRACDELGLLVWDELPWCRGGMGGEVWKQNARGMLKEMIEQNFNHPSIIIWSLGNEISWMPEFPDGDNADSLRAFLKILHEDARQLDPGRVTGIRKYYEGSDIPDVFSPSIWKGWYGGSYFEYENVLTESRYKYKHLFHMEYGGDSHLGRHVENPISGDGYTTFNGWDSSTANIKIKNVSEQDDWDESYMVNLIDWYLHVSEKLDWFIGNAGWLLKEFGTPIRPDNPIPYINEKGAVDRAGKPKDVFYVYKSHWTTDPKFCYIESHTWTDRSGPKNLKRDVKVYSNCSEVELFINGKSEGKLQRDPGKFPAFGLVWQVNFKAGENTIRAIGYENGIKVADDEMIIRYSFKKNGTPERIEFSTEPLENGDILVTAVAIDKNGLRCLDYNKRIYFAFSGPGNLVADYGTSTRSSIIEMANGKAQIEFQPAKFGISYIEARNYDFKNSILKIENEKLIKGRK